MQQPTKAIEAVWETKGKRRRLVGFRAIFDGAELPRLYRYRDEAQRALDELAFDDACHAGVYLMGRAA